jgi:hypothetical protein
LARGEKDGQEFGVGEMFSSQVEEAFAGTLAAGKI